MRTLLADPWSQMDPTAEAARFGGEKFAELDQTVALGKAGRFDDALAIVRSGAGRSLMDDLRRAIDELAADANHEIKRTTAAQNWLSSPSGGAIIVALLCVAGLGAGDY